MTARVTIVGVGGAGCQVIKYMIEDGFGEAKLIAADSDARALHEVPCTNKLLIGKQTKPRPFCSLPPEWCRKAAMDDKQLVTKAVEGSDLVCILAGMGGGMGTGATPAVLGIAKELGILTIAVVTRPFPFEGKRRAANAQRGLEEIEAIADLTVLIPYEVFAVCPQRRRR